MRNHLQGAKRPLAVTAAAAVAALGIVAPAAADTADDDRETLAVVDTPAAPEVGDSDNVAEPTEIPADDEAADVEAPAADANSDDAVEPLNTNTEPVTIDVVGITDFHGYIENMPFLQTQINAIRAANPDTLFVSAGDNIGGSAYVSSIAQDVPTLDVLDAMGLDVSAVGNHEFDKGYADLTDRVIPQIDFEYLGANVEGADEISEPPYHIMTVDGVDIAFVGTVTETTPSIVVRDGIEGLTFLDPVAVTNDVAADLKDGDASNGEADVVVALFHEGNSVAAGLSADVDLVFAGHTHVTADTTTAAGAPILQAGQYGEQFGHATLSVVDGELSITQTRIVDVDTSVTPDAAIQAIVDEALAQAEVLGAQVLAEITENAYRGTNSGSDMGANRGTESSMGNHLANAAMKTANDLEMGADFGIINPGGVRADMDQNGDGEVTYGEAFTTQPFGNTIGTIDLTGEQVYTMLEQQFQPGESRPVLRLGLSDNVTYTYDPTAADGGDITGVWIDGVAVDRAGTYTIASNTFLLAGQDGFTVFEDGTNLRETGIVDLEGYVRYLEAGLGDTIPAGQRSIGIDPVELVAGETVDIDLSSLAFTALEKKPTDVTLYLNGTEVGSSAIDTTVTPNRDDTGKATVTITVPAGAPAKSELRIVTTFDDGTVDTDTTIPVSVTPVVRSVGNWFYVSNDWTSTSASIEFSYGRVGDEVLVGDWDGDGDDTFAVRRGTTFYVTDELKGGRAEIEFVYGRLGDEVVVGDWNGDGTDTFGVRRGNTFYLMNRLAGGSAEIKFDYGRVGDEVLVGDWNNDDVDTITVRRGNEFFVNNRLVGGSATMSYTYGRASDQAFAGDFNGDGFDTISVRRGNVFFINNTLKGGNVGDQLAYGRAGDDVFVGDWNGDGIDTPAVRR